MSEQHYETDVAQEESRLNDILSSINKHNQIYTDETERKRAEERLKQEAKEREERALYMQEQFRLRHEREEKARLVREEEERARLLAEEKQKKKNPFYSLVGKIRDEKEHQIEEGYESSFSLLFANVAERAGDLYVVVRDKTITAYRNMVSKIIQFLAKTIGFAIPEQEDSETALERDEEKRANKRAKREEKRKALHEKRIQRKEEKMQQKEKAKSSAKKNVPKKEVQKPAEPAPSVVASPIPNTPPNPIPTQSPVPENPNAQHITPEKPVRSVTDSAELSDEEWNDMLDDEFRELKEDIVYSHNAPSYRTTERAINDIQMAENIMAVVVATKDMNDLFIFSDKEMFLSLVTEQMNYSVDYAYIYAITPTASMYYGADTCYQKLGNVFDNIRILILRGRRFIDEKALQKIEGINMFRNIYIG